MKCTLCNERNGNTRCEGCNTLFCLPCMNKHHDKLVQQFQLLMHMRNELKQSTEVPESTLVNGKERPCLNEINEWEQESIQRIQLIAANARENVRQIVTKHMYKIYFQFEQLSIDMQERQKEGIYLENDLENIKIQLEQLKNDIEQINEKIRVDSTTSKNIEWNTILYIVEEELPSKTTSELVQSKDTATKDNNRTVSFSKELSGLNSIPIQVVKSDLSAKSPCLISPNQRIARPGICVRCQRSFRNPIHIGFCVDCTQQQRYLHYA